MNAGVKTSAFYHFITMSLSGRFKQHWQEQFPNLQPANCTLLIAVSGGVDSVALTDLIAKSGFNFTIAHCNFQLRGEESERDELFVRNLGEKYKKEVLVKRFNTLQFAEENKIAIQEAARILRYDWFEETRKEIHASFIATAHHADDNIETVLMNVFRGTGIQGLRGILPLQKDMHLIRPLLLFKKEELKAYINAEGLQYIEDSSNKSDKYTRNFFRHKIIPLVKEHYPNAEENLLNNIERFRETEELYRQAIQLHKQKLMEPKGNECHIAVLKLKQATPLATIVWEIMKESGFTAAQTNEIIKLLDANNGSFISSSSHRVIKNRKHLIIAPLQHDVAQHIIIEQKQKKVEFERGVLTIEEITGLPHISTSNLVASVDAKEIKFPLLLRQWKQGDYFYPLGMNKKKKLSRFFIDQKLSSTEKEKTWVIESNKKIIWIIGQRIDDRFKVTPQTKNAIKITFLNKP